MLFLGSSLENRKLLSIRSAGPIGIVTAPIINPHNLHIDGFYCTTTESGSGIILDMDIREIHNKGIIIDDHMDISQQDDLVRLKPILAIDFKLIGKTVYSGHSKVGKVTDYALDTKSLFINKLYVQPSIFKSVKTDQLIFDRAQIVEVTDTKIVVSGPEQKEFSIFGQKLSRPSSLSSASTSSISE